MGGVYRIQSFFGFLFVCNIYKAPKGVDFMMVVCYGMTDGQLIGYK